MPSLSQFKSENPLLVLLTPSWLSGLLAVVGGLILTVGVIAVFSFHNSTIQQQLVGLQQKTEKPLTTPDQILEENDKPTLKGSWPLLIVWSLAGIVAYVVATNIAHTVSEAHELQASLGYVHADRKSLLQSATSHIVAWIVSVGLWVAFTIFFFKWVIPYSITAAHASASELKTVNGILYAVLAFSVMTLALHLHAVFLRLAARRTRIFS